MGRHRDPAGLAADARSATNGPFVVHPTAAAPATPTDIGACLAEWTFATCWSPHRWTCARRCSGRAPWTGPGTAGSCPAQVNATGSWMAPNDAYMPDPARRAAVSGGVHGPSRVAGADAGDDVLADARRASGLRRCRPTGRGRTARGCCPRRRGRRLPAPDARVWTSPPLDSIWWRRRDDPPAVAAAVLPRQHRSPPADYATACVAGRMPTAVHQFTPGEGSPGSVLVDQIRDMVTAPGAVGCSGIFDGFGQTMAQAFADMLQAALTWWLGPSGSLETAVEHAVRPRRPQPGWVDGVDRWGGGGVRAGSRRGSTSCCGGGWMTPSTSASGCSNWCWSTRRVDGAAGPVEPVR